MAANGFAIVAKFGVDAKGVITGVEAAVKKVKKGSKEIKDSGKKMGSGFAEASRSIAGFGKAALGATAGFLALNGVADVASSILDLGGNIADSANRLNLTTDAVQGLKFAFGQSGASSKDFEKSIVALNNKLQDARDGGEGAIEVFKELGFSMVDIDTLTPEAALLRLADYAATAKDETRALATVVGLLGKAGLAMNAGLKAGSEEIKKMSAEAPKMSAETIRRLDAAGDAYEMLLARVKTGIADTLLGFLDSKWADPNAEVVKAMKAAEKKDAAQNNDGEPMWVDPTKDISKREQRLAMTADQRRSRRAAERLKRRVMGEKRPQYISPAEDLSDRSDSNYLGYAKEKQMERQAAAETAAKAALEARNNVRGSRKAKASANDAADAISMGAAGVNTKYGMATSRIAPDPVREKLVSASKVRVDPQIKADGFGGSKLGDMLIELKAINQKLSKTQPIRMK